LSTGFEMKRMKPINQWFKKAVFLWALLEAPGILAQRAGAEEFHVVVLQSHKETPYAQTERGFVDYVKEHDAAARIDVLEIQEDPVSICAQLRSLGAGAQLVFAIGTFAVKVLEGCDRSIPTLVALVLSPKEWADLANATGVYLELSVDVQLEYMKKILPENKKVGVIFSSEENARRVEEARGLARKMGFELEAFRVGSRRDLPSVLKDLSSRVSLLWGLPDEMVINQSTARHLLLFSFQNRIPVVGISQAWVKAGALYALHWDYPDIGRQCGEMAMKIRDGVAPGIQGAVAPRKIVYSVNQRTAEHMKVDLDPSVVLEAQAVY
jgi:putative tryptophan/tyrosine transport system substrate-binding protein